MWNFKSSTSLGGNYLGSRTVLTMVGQIPSGYNIWEYQVVLEKTIWLSLACRKHCTVGFFGHVLWTAAGRRSCLSPRFGFRDCPLNHQLASTGGRI